MGLRWGRAVFAGAGAFLCTSALLLVQAVVPAHGQDKPQDKSLGASLGASVQIDKKSFQTTNLDFHVPAGDLGTALRQWANQTGLKLLVSTDAIKDQHTAGLEGRFTAEAALKQLLASTPLKYGITGQRSVTVYDPNSALTAHAQSVQLDTIQVEGQANRKDDSVQGFVAKRSSAGTKTDTPILETPQSISVVTRDQMDARAVQTVVEALQYTPGVYTQGGGKDPRFDNFSMRGFSAYGSGVYRDGLRELGDSNFFSLFKTEPYGLERVDVVRGPSSVLYGQNNPGGLIDMISKRPTATPVREVVAQYATADRFQGAFDFSGAVDKDAKFLYRLTGVARDADAQIAHFSKFVKDDRQFIAPSFTWQPTQDTKLTILTDFQHDLTGNAFPLSLVTVKPGVGVTNVYATNLFLGEPSYNKFEQDQFRLGYQFEHRFSDALTFKQNFRYGQVSLDYRYLTYSGTPVDTISTYGRVSRQIDERTESLTVDNQLLAKFNIGAFQHTLLAGLDHQRFGLDDVTTGNNNTVPGNTVPSLSRINPVYGVAIPAPNLLISSVDQDAKQLGTYVQDQIKLQNWLLTVGARYDWADMDSMNRVAKVKTVTDDEAFTKRIGLTYLFDFGLAPYVSYADSFLPTPGVDFFSNPFKPTSAQQYEAGIKYQMPNTNVLVTLAVFDLTQQNVLTTDPLHANYKVQIGEVHSRGFEAQATATLTQGLNLMAAYTYLDLEVTQTTTASELGKVPVLTPRNMASAWADYTFQNGPLAGFGFGGGVRYIGSTFMDTANLLVNDAYTVFDAALHYKIKNGMNFALNVSNVADKTVAACTVAGGCQWISPRIVTGTLTYKW